MASMIERLGRRLLVSFGPSEDWDQVAPTARPAADARPLIEFVAYGEDCLFSGRLRLSAARLTDMLNGHDEYELIDVMVEPLDGRTAAEVRHVIVQRHELVLVHASGPRGSSDRRHRTRPHALAVQLGPYHVRGHLHAPPGIDPVVLIRRRAAMVPLTDATIEFRVAGAWHLREAGTVVVNRDRIDWVMPDTGS